MDFFGDPLLSEFTKLTGIVTIVATTTANFKSELAQLQQTLQRIFPLITDPVRLNQILDRQKEESATFIEKIIDAEKLVNNCLKIKWNLFKWFTHSLKLKDLNNKLLRFFQLEVQADQSRDIKQTLLEVHDVNIKMDRLTMELDQINRTASSISLSVSSRREGGYESTERRKLGWRVPILPGGIVAFDEPLKNLKAKVVADESAVVVVAAAGGCGKTTLTIMLCHDPEIRGKFGENIFFVTVTETPNFMVIVNDLFNPNSASQLIPFQSDEDAKHKLGNFLLEKVSGPMLLVLDDVWDDSFIEKFSVNINGCKILVTSRTAFPKYDVFEFDPLSDEDAKILFHHSAFSESKKRPKTLIAENLVNQELKTIADQLANVDAPVSDNDMVIQLITGLNDQYEGIGSIIQNTDPLPSFNAARSKVTMEEQKKSHQAAANASATATALHASAPKSETSTTPEHRFSSYSERGRGRGHRGRGRGRNSWGRGRGSQNNFGANGTIGQYHSRPPWPSNNAWPTYNAWPNPPCPYPTRPASNFNDPSAGLLGPRPSMAHLAASTPTNIEQALYTMSLNPPDQWHMDTGATSHMTNNPGFQDPDPYPTMQQQR